MQSKEELSQSSEIQIQFFAKLNYNTREVLN